MLLNTLSFYLILTLTFPVRFLSYPMIHRLGNALGTLLFYLSSKFRKRALSNLALATTLDLNEKEIRRLAKESIQNLLITCLEYAKFASENNIARVAGCENPETAEALMNEKKPVIFFCGHLSNWEVLFLEGSKRMKGVAIGRPIDNAPLYNWILSIRQKYGGVMLSRKNAIKEGLRGLKHGAFLGIVGDQGMPDSGFSSPFFGRTAWTSPVPAMLSYRTGSPLIVATTRRDKGRYVIHYSDPIWPHPELPMDPEVNRMMREALHYLEEGIRKAPGQWLWTHNRWKQQTPERLKRQFRHESMLIILPRECDAILPHLATFRELYPREFITVMAPVRHQVTLQDAEIIPYTTDDELFIRDYRFKLVFNFTSEKKLNSHFKKLAAFHVATLEDFPGENLSSQLKQGVLRAGV